MDTNYLFIYRAVGNTVMAIYKVSQYKIAIIKKKNKKMKSDVYNFIKLKIKLK